MNNKLLTIAAIGAVSCLMILPAHANSLSTEEFVKKVSVANLFEVESSKLALDKSQNHNVRKFAEEMIEDHGKAQDNLKEAVKAPETDAVIATTLDRKHQKLLDKLKKISSSDDFDRQYIDIHRKSHAEAVALFNNYAKNGKNNVIKEFAEETIPTLEEHYEHIKEIQSE